MNRLHISQRSMSACIQYGYVSAWQFRLNASSSPSERLTRATHINVCIYGFRFGCHSFSFLLSSFYTIRYEYDKRCGSFISSVILGFCSTTIYLQQQQLQFFHLNMMHNAHKNRRKILYTIECNALPFYTYMNVRATHTCDTNLCNPVCLTNFVMICFSNIVRSDE